MQQGAPLVACAAVLMTAFAHRNAPTQNSPATVVGEGALAALWAACTFLA